MSQQAAPGSGPRPRTGGPTWDDEDTRALHRGIADRIIAIANPKTTLDLGCGPGLLVQALAEKGVDAHGVDVDEAALAGAHPEVLPRLEVAAESGPVPGRYDLITCTDVVERLDARSAQALVEAVCAATDRVLFASDPDAFGDPTHLHVHPTADWAAAFAERGFYRRTDVNLDFVADYAVLFERSALQPRDLVHRYEERLHLLTTELRERRRALAELRAEGVPGGAGGSGELAEQLERALHDVLTTRDHIIGLEAESVQLQNQVAQLTRRLAAQQSRTKKLRARLANQQRRARRAERRLEKVRASRAWRLGRRLTRTTDPEL